MESELSGSESATAIRADPGPVVGSEALAIDWEERTAGATRYAGDLEFPRLLVGGSLRSPHAHARIAAIDTREALKVPGVRAVLTAADFPPNLAYVHRGGSLSDRRPLARGLTRYVGEEIAAVAAESEEALAKGMQAIKVKYRPLRGPLNLDDARLRGIRRLHSRGEGANVSVQIGVHWGGARAPIAVSSSGTCEYPAVSHTVMEPNVTVAWWRAGEKLLELWTSTQAPWFISWEVAHCLGLKQEQVVCREVAVGGGFGARSKVGEHEVLAAALSRATNRPVRIQLDRVDEFATTRHRHAARIHTSLGASQDGRLITVQADAQLDNGAYNHMGPTVLYAAADYFGSIYHAEEVSVDARLVDTATPPGGPFRGYGAPQAALAMESELDRLAERLQLDPIELRLRNADLANTVAPNGSRYTTVGLSECLEAIREARASQAGLPRSDPSAGFGVASAAHGGAAFAYPGANEGRATVDIDTGGQVRVLTAGADAGTGQRTILAQIAAEELGIPIGDVAVLSMESDRAPVDMGAWSSRGTHMSGNAVKVTAAALAARLRRLAEGSLGPGVALVDGHARGDGTPIPLGHVVGTEVGAGGRLAESRAYVAHHMKSIESEQEDAPPANFYADYSFAAHGAEVRVDERTGELTVTRYVAAHDSGRIINPIQATGQVVGAVVMGLGAVQGEEMIRTEGRLANATYLDYACPRAADVPDIDVKFFGEPDPRNPLGSKNIGEIGIVPVAPAVTNAVADAVGIRLTSVPATPDKVLAALAARDGRQRRWTVWRQPSRWWVAFVRWAYPRGLHAVLHRFGTRFARDRGVAPVRDIYRPKGIEEAIEALGESGAVIGGGTDLMVRRREGLASFERLIEVDGLPGMRSTTVADDGLVIGGAVTLAELEHDPRVPAILRETIKTIASTQVRNVATIAGNLLQEKRCWYYRTGFDCYKRGGTTCPCYAVLGDHRFYHAAMRAHRCQAVTPSDVATTLVALDAEVIVEGPRGRRVVASGDLFVGPGESTLAEREIVTEIRIARDACRRDGSFKKLRIYDGGFATVSAALTAEPASDIFRNARLVLGAIAPIPWRAHAAELSLEGGARTAETVRAALDAELARVAHPLPGNAWKVDAAIGLAMNAADDLLAGSSAGTDERRR